MHPACGVGQASASRHRPNTLVKGTSTSGRPLPRGLSVTCLPLGKSLAVADRIGLHAHLCAWPSSSAHGPCVPHAPAFRVMPPWLKQGSVPAVSAQIFISYVSITHTKHIPLSHAPRSRPKRTSFLSSKSVCSIGTAWSVSHACGSRSQATTPH